MKLLGGILLVVGTAIGGGMLALPIATSPEGFVTSSLLLFFCWCLMTASAFLILEANLWLPHNSNLISMVKRTLGGGWEVIAWFSYLLLLYSLLAAYMAGGGDFFKSLLATIHIQLKDWQTTLIFTIVLGYVVFHGIRSVDLVNRILIFIKFSTLIGLIAFVVPHVSLPLLKEGEIKYVTSSITVALTSFGFATIIPSLRTYFNGDVKKLRLAIWVGSLLPLISYIVWDFAIMGVIPRGGENGLIAMLNSGRSTSESVRVLSAILNQETITSLARGFTSVCLLTSFLGVALCLSDFLSDGLGLEKIGINKFIIVLATFFPPLLIVFFYPGAFIKALSYAGIFCIILLVLLPCVMVWYGRYKKQIAKGYRVPGGKVLLVLLMVMAVLIIVQSIVTIL